MLRRRTQHRLSSVSDTLLIAPCHLVCADLLLRCARATCRGTSLVLFLYFDNKLYVGKPGEFCLVGE